MYDLIKPKIAAMAPRSQCSGTKFDRIQIRILLIINKLKMIYVSRGKPNVFCEYLLTYKPDNFQHIHK